MKTVKQAITKETTIASAANAVLAITLTYLALPKEETLPLLGGPEAAGFAMLPPSIGFPLLAPLLISFVVKKSVAAGEIDTSTGKPINWLPKNTFLTAILMVIFAIAVFLPLAIGLVWLIFGSELSYATAMAVNVIYMIALGLVLIPIVVRRAVHLQR